MWYIDYKMSQNDVKWKQVSSNLALSALLIDNNEHKMM